MGALDKQEGGSHYKDMPIQPVEFIVANSIPYREANVIKYVARHATKNGVQDINKAIHYLEMIRDDYEAKTQSESDSTQIGEKSESGSYKSESSSSDKNTTAEPDNEPDNRRSWLEINDPQLRSLSDSTLFEFTDFNESGEAIWNDRDTFTFVPTHYRPAY